MKIVLEWMVLVGFVLTALSINIWPVVIYAQLQALRARVDELYVTVSDDPDPGADEDEPAKPENVVAIGKRAA